MKVLIISHLPAATQNNMGKTFMSLFSQFRQEELCQLYIYPAIPDVSFCSSYYRVTDKEILASLLGKKQTGGEIDPSRISPSEGLYEKEEDESFYRNRKNKRPVRRLLRDAMWAMAPWYNENLTRWLEREDPSCIFLAPGAAKFIYNIALRVSAERNIPIVSYICDEYYFVKAPKAIGEKLRLKLLQDKIEKTLKNSSYLVVICDELKEAYATYFGVAATTLMTGAGFEVAKEIRTTEEPETISYFGNIRCNRYVSLCDVGEALEQINREKGTGYRLRVYTSEKDPEILAALKKVSTIELCGFVTGEEFERIFHRAQLLLHVEAFDEESIDSVRHSVSTKIADSLGSGIPLLAYGPDCVSSMKHLIRHECALSATSRRELSDMLRAAFSDGEARNAAAENGLTAACEYHNSRVTSEKLRKIMLDVSERGSEE